MVNYSVLDRVPKTDRPIYVQVIKLMTAINNYVAEHPELGKDRKYRCHSICDAVASCVPTLRVVDGHYLGLKPKGKKAGIVRCDHSWLLTAKGTVIDPYPVGTVNVNPLIFPFRGKYRWYGRSHYVEDPEVSKEVRTPELTQESAHWIKVVGIVRATMKEL